MTKGDTNTSANTDSLQPLSDAQKEILHVEDLIQMMAARRIKIGSGSGSLVDDSNSRSRSDIFASLEGAASVEVENEKGKGKGGERAKCGE